MALFLSVRQAGAIIDVTLQMQLGNPSNATADTNNHNHYLMQRPVQSLDYSDNLGEPVWASWDLTASDVGTVARLDNYTADASLPAGFYRVTDGDYNGVGSINFNRGHMCPSEDRTDTRADNDMLFLMTNIIPQAADNNQGVWGNFEAYCRSLVSAGNELLIVCGPSGFGTNRIPSGKAVIATNTWKIAVVVPLGAGTALSRITNSTRVISVKIPNTNGVSPTWQNFITTARDIENETHFTFFTALPGPVASALRYNVDGQTAPAPSVSNFSPGGGVVNDSITITGANFASVLAVKFNGVSATFDVNSATQITALVPTNATSGQISVQTAAGTASSTASFSVNGATSIDLAIAATHAGNFTQGDIGDTYTLTVTNVGSATTSGTVTVTNALPAGLTATAIGGTGWTSNLANLTCTRSDVLTAGAGYPPITITVNVSAGAAASVTNTARVSGGGDASPANNTASDPTTINPAIAPSITTQPQSQSVVVGQDASFSVTANGTAPLSYQWRVNGTNVPGATLSSYTRTGAQLTDAGDYSVVVTNVAGSVTSSTATLAVVAPASSSIVAQWNFNSVVADANTGTGSILPSAGTGTLVSVGGTSQTFFGGSANDPAAAGTDNSGLSTSSYAAQGTGNKARGLQFSLSTTGYQNIAMTWDQRLSTTASKYYELQYTTNGTDYLDFGIITMASNGAFESKTNNLNSVAGINDNANFAFRIVAVFESNAVNNANANYVTTSTSGYGASGTVRYDLVTVYAQPLPPKLLAQPAGRTFAPGDTVSFSVSATSVGGLTYQWKKDGTPLSDGGTLSGTETATLTIAGAVAGDAGSYTVDVFGAGLATTSSAAVLVLKAATTTTLASSANPATPGSPVTFTATVSPATLPNANTPGGTVQFKTNGAALGSPVTLNGGGVATSSIALLPHGSNSVTAEYVGDTNFLAGSGALSQVINVSPVAGTANYQRPKDLQLKFSVAGLLANATDADLDALSLLSVSSASTNNAVISNSGTTIFYTPPASNGNVTDRFNYTVNDAFGGQGTGTVVVTIAPGGTNQTVNVVGVSVLADGNKQISFAGVPGQSYVVQAAASLAAPVTWTTLGTMTAGNNGQFSFADLAATNFATRYYRTTVP